MAGRKIRDEADARACLDAAASSGLTRGDWAREHGIDGRSLNAWKNNLERREPEPATRPTRLVELVPAPVVPTPTPARYLVRCGGFTVEVDDRFEEATLGRLLMVVASC